MTDEKIIELYFMRDESAVLETKNSYDSKLKGLATKIVKSKEDGEECVSDTYLKAWNTIPPQKPVYFFAYLAKICRFICFGKLDYANAKKRSAEIVELSDELMMCIPSRLSDTTLSEELLKTALNSFLATLPTEKRLIFLRRFWFSDSISQIAKRYKLSESKVKTSLFRTKKLLKNHLEKEGVQI